jgi:ABC-type Fe3+-hydroxamate transport system substrate-binding protein
MRIADDLGRDLLLGPPPRKIISLVPSETYNVVKLGAGDRLIGRTDYCVHPAEAVAGVPTVGGTKNPRVDEIIALEPDLVLANQEEGSKGDLERLVKANVRVFISFPRRVADGIAHLARLARILGVGTDGDVKDVLRQAYAALREAEAARAGLTPVRAFVPIWMDPLMTIHGDTFISDMMDLAGAYNVFADRQRRYPLAADLGRAAPLAPEKIAGRDTRYPRITLDEVIARAPDIVLLPDEPHPFSPADVAVFQAADLPAARYGTIVTCEGRDLSWPGAVSIEGIGRMRKLVADLRARVPVAGASA